MVTPLFAYQTEAVQRLLLSSHHGAPPGADKCVEPLVYGQLLKQNDQERIDLQGRLNSCFSSLRTGSLDASSLGAGKTLVALSGSE